MKRLRTIPLEGVTLGQLREEFDRVGRLFLERVPDGSGASRGPDTEPGWITGLRNAWIVTPDHWGLGEFPMLSVAIMNLSMHRGGGISARRVEGVMVNELAGGAKLDTHRDGPPHHERWHLPIVTNRGVRYWEEGIEPQHMVEGVWTGPIDHSSRHWMSNAGSEARVHIVADLEKPDD